MINNGILGFLQSLGKSAKVGGAHFLKHHYQVTYIITSRGISYLYDTSNTVNKCLKCNFSCIDNERK
jgi:hypothetical protein